MMCESGEGARGSECTDVQSIYIVSVQVSSLVTN